MRRVCRAGEWGTLEESLALEVRRARAVDPLRPIGLLVGSNLLGLYLRRLLARRLGAIAAVRTLTFLDLAERRAGPALCASGRQPLPPLGGEILLGRLLAGAGEGSYFGAVGSLEGLRGALLETIRDLKEAGWSPSDLRRSLRGARYAGARGRRLAALAEIYERYEASLRAGFYDRSDLLAEAATLAERARRSAEGPLLLVYGFYDLIALQWRLLRAESRLRETVVFVPWDEGP